MPVSTKCSLDVSGTVFALNATVLPRQPLAFLSMWQPLTKQPLTSVIHAFDGAVTSNSAMVAASALGEISVYATDPTDLILDLNGFFAPETAP